MRFSLRWLFGVILFVAIASTSLIYSSWWLSDGLAAALGAFLVCVTIGAVYGRSASAAFCGGSAIAGWVYLLCLWLPLGHIGQNDVAPTAAVDRAVYRLYESISWELRAEPINGDLSTAYFVNGVPYIKRPLLEPFVKAAHCLTAFVVAMLGGAVGRRFQRG
ncbi:MAG TPA: hypothetical protein VHC22_26120 [Pirellulales bacterium]|nr:hypothetical protein [Pirellulales bacterium]